MKAETNFPHEVECVSTEIHCAIKMLCFLTEAAETRNVDGALVDAFNGVIFYLCDKKKELQKAVDNELQRLKG